MLGAALASEGGKTVNANKTISDRVATCLRFSPVPKGVAGVLSALASFKGVAFFTSKFGPAERFFFYAPLLVGMALSFARAVYG